MKRRFLALVALVAAAGLSCKPVLNADLAPKSNAKLIVTADEFKDGQSIPATNTADGGNVSPTIGWSEVPAGAKSVAMVVDDSDADGFVHWVIYNIPPDRPKLPPGLAATERLDALGSALQGKNSRGTVGYFGPQPPPGKPHHYHFRVYAIDSMLPLAAGASKDDVVQAMSGHVLAQGELVGLFQSR